MRLPINISDESEDTEWDVLDLEFDTEIEGKSILKIDWNKKEDEIIQTRNFNVVKRKERWLRNQKFKEGPHMSSHESRID